MMAVLLEAEMTNTPEPERERGYLNREAHIMFPRQRCGGSRTKQCQYKSGRGVEGFVVWCVVWGVEICALAVLGKCLVLLEAFRIEKMRTPG